MGYSLLVEKDMSIPLRDGATVVADVFRPAEAGTFPVIMTLGPYPKDIHFSEWNPAAWEGVPERGPYMHWETVNPEWWVPLGYVVIRCDTRGTGKSPGTPRLLSRAEAEDFYDAATRRGRRRGGRSTPTTRSRSYDPARSSPSRSRSGRPASWSSVASASFWRSVPRTIRGASSSTTTHAIAHGRERTRFTRVASSTRTCCCRSSLRDDRRLLALASPH